MPLAPIHDLEANNYGSQVDVSEVIGKFLQVMEESTYHSSASKYIFSSYHCTESLCYLCNAMNVWDDSTYKGKMVILNPTEFELEHKFSLTGCQYYLECNSYIEKFINGGSNENLISERTCQHCGKQSKGSILTTTLSHEPFLDAREGKIVLFQFTLCCWGDNQEMLRYNTYIAGHGIVIDKDYRTEEGFHFELQCIICKSGITNGHFITYLWNSVDYKYYIIDDLTGIQFTLVQLKEHWKLGSIHHIF